MKRIIPLISVSIFFTLLIITNAYALSDRPAVTQGGAEGEKTEEEKIAEARRSLEKKAPARTRSADIKRGGLLLKGGEIESDLTFTYAHFSENQLVIEGFAILPVLVIGEVNIEKIKQDILMASATWRYGLTDRIQLEARLPYRYHYQRFFRPDIAVGQEEETNQSHGVGDISASLLFHLLNEEAATPHVVAALTFKSAIGDSVFDIDPRNGEIPMGTGFYSLKGSLSFVKTADPAVVFWNLGYTHNFSRKDNIFLATQDPETKEITYTETKTKLSPGETFEMGFGVAYAISYKLALSTQYQHSITVKTKKDGKFVSGTFLNAGAIRIGGVWAWSNMKKYHLRSIDLSTTFGVTVDAPDTVVELRFTHRY